MRMWAIDAVDNDHQLDDEEANAVVTPLGAMATGNLHFAVDWLPYEEIYQQRHGQLVWSRYHAFHWTLPTAWQNFSKYMAWMKSFLLRCQMADMFPPEFFPEERIPTSNATFKQGVGWLQTLSELDKRRLISCDWIFAAALQELNAITCMFLYRLVSAFETKHSTKEMAVSL